MSEPEVVPRRPMRRAEPPERHSQSGSCWGRWPSSSLVFFGTGGRAITPPETPPRLICPESPFCLSRPSTRPRPRMRLRPASGRNSYTT
jgi:hypothetical protein